MKDSSEQMMLRRFMISGTKDKEINTKPILISKIGTSKELLHN